MEVLNLDDFTKQARTITMNGKSHEVIDMTVEDYIETSKAIEEMKKVEAVSDADQVLHAVGMISRRVPTLNKDDLKKLSMAKLSMIMKFIQGELDEEAKEVKEEKEETKGKVTKAAKK
jgi:ABC-type multidrug transport system ATPase subunit